VQAAPWIPVEEVRLYGNGQLVTRIPVPPSDSVVRFDGAIELEPLTRDTYFVVEAGQQLPDDPRQQPPSGDLVAIIAPGVVSLAFTNPIFVDVDGNGVFDPPGVTPSITSQKAVREKLKRALAQPSHHLEAEWQRFKIAPDALKQFMKSFRVRHQAH
jgi:hypothetical protein